MVDERVKIQLAKSAEVIQRTEKFINELKIKFSRLVEGPRKSFGKKIVKAFEDLLGYTVRLELRNEDLEQVRVKLFFKIQILKGEIMDLKSQKAYFEKYTNDDLIQLIDKYGIETITENVNASKSTNNRAA